MQLGLGMDPCIRFPSQAKSMILMVNVTYQKGFMLEE